MADSKISALPASTTPLTGTEAVPIVQGGTTKQVAVSDLTAGRTPAAANFINGYTAVVSAAGTTTLTATSTYVQKLSGSSTQTFKLPDATTITAGTAYIFDNDSTGLLTVVDNASGAVTTVPSGSAQYVFLETAGSAAGSWGKYAFIGGAGALSVTSGKSVSVTNSLTLSGTDSTTMTFPSTNASIARTDAAQTFSGNQTFASNILFPNGKVTSASTGTIAVAGTYVITLAPIVSGILSYEIELVGAGNNNTRAVYFISSRYGSVNATSLSAATQGLGATHTITAGSDGSSNLTITIANTNVTYAETGVWSFVGTLV